MPRDEIIGPGQRCVHCHSDYGLHTPGCPVLRQQKNAVTALGQAVREALERKDDLELGRLLQKIVER